MQTTKWHKYGEYQYSEKANKIHEMSDTKWKYLNVLPVRAISVCNNTLIRIIVHMLGLKSGHMKNVYDTFSVVVEC